MKAQRKLVSPAQTAGCWWQPGLLAKPGPKSSKNASGAEELTMEKHMPPMVKHYYMRAE